MASRAPIMGAPTRAPSNVVHLPTAADRKVKQPTARRCWLAVRAGGATPIGVDYMTPWQRRRADEKDALAQLERTPALLIAMALLRSADAHAQSIVLATTAVAAAGGNDAAKQAAALARALCVEAR